MASAELRDTRRRISSVEAIKKITRAMELIAAARIPKAQGRVNASKPYSAKLIDVIENVGGAAGEREHLLLERREVTKAGILVVAADRGLAGAYATNIIRFAERRIAELARQGVDANLFVVGKKAQVYFQYRGYRIRRSFLDVTDTPGYGDAVAIANTLFEAWANDAIHSLEGFYTRFQSALTQTPTRYDLLPIIPPEQDAEGPVTSYEYEPSAGEILDKLLPRYVEATIYSMLLEASASEHSARRRAMKAATDNAEDLVKTLSVQANRARQAEITTAITEIVGGAEALAQ
ncbi:MAG: F0F1 ATP synthase subunit gamma [Acidimicrobiia bacterium]|nr:F0F1 ATP synthase subunit gamma [Acidimicrobiia bacterium]